jgi:hypothetical protein
VLRTRVHPMTASSIQDLGERNSRPNATPVCSVCSPGAAATTAARRYTQRAHGTGLKVRREPATSLFSTAASPPVPSVRFGDESSRRPQVRNVPKAAICFGGAPPAYVPFTVSKQNGASCSRGGAGRLGLSGDPHDQGPDRDAASVCRIPSRSGVIVASNVRSNFDVSMTKGCSN